MSQEEIDVTTLVVPTNTPVETVDELSDRLTRYRDHNPDTFIVELGDITTDTVEGELLPYALGYMRSAGYGLTDINWSGEKEMHFKKVIDDDA